MNNIPDDSFRKDDDNQARPWRKHAIPVGKPPSNPDYPKAKFDKEEWLRTSKKMDEDSQEMPEIGSTIRTKKMQMEGIVERMGQNRAGYDEVYFRTQDGRLMKTPLENVTVVQKIEDGYTVMPGIDTNRYQERTGLEGPFRAKTGKVVYYDPKEGKYYDPDSDFYISHEEWDEMKEGSMGGINRAAPAQDVSYEKVLDEVMQKWKEEQINELSVKTMQDYARKAGSEQSVRARPLSKLAKSVPGVQRATAKINAKTGQTKRQGPDRGAYEESSACSASNEAIDPWKGYTPDDKNAGALQKAPKTSMQGNVDVPFSKLVQDTIDTHGVKWAFQYYVVKNGLPPRQFKIFAGL